MTDQEHRTIPDYQFIELDSVDSTNTYALAQIQAGLAKGGEVYLARRQFAGKGQRGKEWLSEPGQTLAMSLVLDAEFLHLSQQFLLSAATALGCLHGVQAVFSEGWRLKWPNDLYWQNKKAAGILIENTIRGKEWRYAVIGMGMNLNQTSFPINLPCAVSLKQITGKDFLPIHFAQQLVLQIGKQIRRLQTDPSAILNDYNESLYRLGESIRFGKENKFFETKLRGVNEAGMVMTDAGIFEHGEVELLIDCR